MTDTTDTRARISGHIDAHPGVHFNELVRALDLAPGQVQHHLRGLLDARRFTRRELYGRTHYFPPGYDEWEQTTLALARRETARDVLFSLLERGPSAPNEVAAELDIARSTLEWHLDHLVEAGVVEKRRDERNRVTLALVRPAETTRLLRNIVPSLPERMVDRFTRLVDRLLE